MSDDPTKKVELDAPDDPRCAARTALQERLGLRPKPDDEYDAVAQELLDETGALMAGVNLYGCEIQYFIGVAKRADLGPVTEKDRTMNLGWGYCGDLLTKRVAPLTINTKDNPALATNPVAQYLGVEAYHGDELRIPTGEEFATLWAVFDEEQDWKQPRRDRFQTRARKLEARIIERSGITTF